MNFTSWSYLVFLAAVFIVHGNIPARARRARNAVLVVASLGFYCSSSWESAWKHALVLLFLSAFNWLWGNRVVARASATWPLVLGVVTNLLPLVALKYGAFFARNANALAELAGARGRLQVPETVALLGISYFTFQGIAYLVDVAAGEEPIEGFLDFLLYRTFWAQLVAGPIVRPGEVHEAIVGERVLRPERVGNGCRRILHGIARKVILADGLAPFADAAFDPGVVPSASDCLFGALAFGLQIYFDFAACSDIAIGSAQLFGIDFPENFDFPYLARSPSEFWRRWHMSLTRWIRDYIHAPLAFATRSRPKLAYVWTLVAMVLCGLWHGAEWTFVAWGAWHGALLVLDRTVLGPLFKSSAILATGATFVLVNAGWIIFRASSLAQAGSMLATLVRVRGELGPHAIKPAAIAMLVLVLALTLGSRAGLRALERLRAFEPLADAALVIGVLAFATDARAFIYARF